MKKLNILTKQIKETESAKALLRTGNQHAQNQESESEIDDRTRKERHKRR